MSIWQMISTKWCFHNSTIKALEWSPDGKYLVSGGLDNMLSVWSVDSPVKPLCQVPSKAINLV